MEFICHVFFINFEQGSNRCSACGRKAAAEENSRGRNGAAEALMQTHIEELQKADQESGEKA